MSQPLSLRALQAGKTVQPSRNDLARRAHSCKKSLLFLHFVGSCKNLTGILQESYMHIHARSCKILQNARKIKDLFLQDTLARLLLLGAALNKHSRGIAIKKLLKFLNCQRGLVL